MSGAAVRRGVRSLSSALRKVADNRHAWTRQQHVDLIGTKQGTSCSPAASQGMQTGALREMATDIEHRRHKPHAATKLPEPPKFGGSVLGGSPAQPPPAAPARPQKAKRKVTMVPAPSHAPKPTGSGLSLQSKDLSAAALKGLGVGGLDAQLEDLFRRAFASRLVPPGVAAAMGLSHVKGILLYGPPGTGKTLVARKIGRLLAGDKEPEVVNGPELLQRWVGQSEANIRALFEDAETEYRKKGEEAGLHVIIFDEIDALCKARGSGGSGGTGHSGVGDSVVNQLLTKLDGVESAPNLLVIGLTNRRDLLDEALLRPGRFEVQMEVGLPDAAGRRQILDIHTGHMRDNGLLSPCVDLGEIADNTRNFSGAELAGLVRTAASHAYNRLLQEHPNGGLSSPDNASGTSGDDRNGAATGPSGPGTSGRLQVAVRQDDFWLAISEVTPALGASGASRSGSKAFKRWMPHGIIRTGAHLDGVLDACEGLVSQVRRGTPEDAMVTALLEGPPGAGKTALAASVALGSGFPFARVVCAADTMVGMDASQRSTALRKAFDDALSSPASVLVLDNLERILGFSSLGGSHFSHEVLQTLHLLLRRVPPEGRRLLVLGTTSSPEVVQAFQESAAFDVSLRVAALVEPHEKAAILQEVMGISPAEAAKAAEMLPRSVPVKHLLKALKLAAAAEVAGKREEGPPDGAGEEAGEAATGAAVRVTAAGLQSYLSNLSSVGTDAALL